MLTILAIVLIIAGACILVQVYVLPKLVTLPPTRNIAPSAQQKLTQSQQNFIASFRGFSADTPWSVVREKIGEPNADMSPNNIYHTYFYKMPADNGLDGSVYLTVPYNSDAITGGHIFGKLEGTVVIDEDLFMQDSKPMSDLSKAILGTWKSSKPEPDFLDGTILGSTLSFSDQNGKKIFTTSAKPDTHFSWYLAQVGSNTQLVIPEETPQAQSYPIRLVNGSLEIDYVSSYSSSGIPQTKMYKKVN
jgi:hypothetical protein